LENFPTKIISNEARFVVPSAQEILEGNKYTPNNEQKFNHESLALIKKYNRFVKDIIGVTEMQESPVIMFKNKIESLLSLHYARSIKKMHALDRWQEILERQLKSLMGADPIYDGISIVKKMDIIKQYSNKISATTQYDEFLESHLNEVKNISPNLKVIMLTPLKLNENPKNLTKNLNQIIDKMPWHKKMSYRLLGTDYPIDKKELLTTLKRFLLKGSAISTPIDIGREIESDWRANFERICPLVVNRHTLNQDEYLQRMTGVNLVSSIQFGIKQQQSFTIAHELGHCFDTNLHDDKSYYAMNQGEIFADLMGIFHLYKYFGKSLFIEMIPRFKLIAAVNNNNSVPYLPMKVFLAAKKKVELAMSLGTFNNMSIKDFKVWAKEITYGDGQKKISPIYSKQDYIYFENLLERIDNSRFSIDQKTGEVNQRTDDQVALDNQYIYDESLKFNYQSKELLKEFSIAVKFIKNKCDDKCFARRVADHLSLFKDNSRAKKDIILHWKNLVITNFYIGDKLEIPFRLSLLNGI
ncbi:MAG: hypothetical protein HON90_06990, partial [Halobacteriovoraceae bacterium]|nr:hypothetical protein [Halobacteriovoraceae bacterium]